MPRRKPTITSQCAQPTLRNRFIRVCAATSTTTVRTRGSTGRSRVPSGLPRRKSRVIRTSPPKNSPQQSAVMRPPMTPKVIVAVFKVSSPNAPQKPLNSNKSHVTGQ